MDISIGNKISGTDIHGNSIKGEITGILNVFRIVTVKTWRGQAEYDYSSFR